MDTTKICRRCDVAKPLKEFYKRKGYKKVSHLAWCIDCQKLLSRNRYLADKEQRWIEGISRKYGITHSEYSKLNNVQRGQCAICFTVPASHKLAVDHHHASKKVRGLLCRSCNLIIGLCKEDPKTLENAIRYLAKYC